MNKKDQQALAELNAYLASRDEKTNKQSDKKILGMEFRSKNQAWLDKVTENAKDRSKDQLWLSTTAERNRAMATDETWKKKHADGIKKREASLDFQQKRQQGFDSRILKDESREAIANASQTRFNDPEWRKKHQEKINQRTNDPVWKARQKEARLNRTMAVMTPSGLFSTQKEAIEWASKNGLKNAGAKLSKWLKDKEPGFYLITREEYNKLTGKEYEQTRSTSTGRT